MELLKTQVRKQLAFNKGKNFFHPDFSTLFKFLKISPEIMDEVKRLDRESENKLIDHVTDMVAGEFGKINQYYSLNQQSLISLKSIYSQLFSDLKRSEFTEGREFRKIEKKHFTRLKIWITLHNGFANEIYSNQSSHLKDVPCAEYSPESQIEVLSINIQNIIEPVLDVGCGMNGNLVMYLRSKNIEAFGIDRFAHQGSFFEKCDWLEYDFDQKKWGTIISNLGFSNHFNHHNLRTDGNYVGYGQKYMKILESLKTGGSFYYAPDLPFIEKYLDHQNFSIEKAAIRNTHYKSSRITRLN